MKGVQAPPPPLPACVLMPCNKNLCMIEVLKIVENAPIHMTHAGCAAICVELCMIKRAFKVYIITSQIGAAKLIKSRKV